MSVGMHQESKETLKNGKREAQTCTTKVAAKQECASQKIPKTICGCVDESARQRVESSVLAKHEDHIAGKGFTSMSHCKLVHKFIPVPQTMKISDAKAAVEKEWKKLETIPAWEQVKSKKEVILEAQRDKKKVHFATLMDTQERGVGTQIKEVQRQSRAPEGHCERRL